ncbi:MAG TPA: dihydrofolate reductase family protein [Anaerolineales bacterium]|nr:dihydrofolate reductase family protein [Anaerolineales bacterium]
MRRLIEVTFESLDGVMDAPDIVQEARPYFLADPEHDKYARDRLFAADALLLGRKTYEAFARSYPQMAASQRDVPKDFVDYMNSIPKYVASTTLQSATWNATIIKGDVAEEVRKLKEQPGRDIVKYGTGQLDRVLFSHNLVDLLSIYVYPFILGHGTRLFEGVGLTTHLKLADVRRLKNGTVILDYSRE